MTKEEKGNPGTTAGRPDRDGEQGEAAHFIRAAAEDMRMAAVRAATEDRKNTDPKREAKPARQSRPAPDPSPSNPPEYTYLMTSGRSAASGAEWHWTDYMGILLDKIWLILAITAFVLAQGVWRTLREVPLYRSSARIMVEEHMPKVLNVDDLLSAGARNVEYFNTHVLALSSRSMVEAAMTKKTLGENPLFVPSALAQADKVSAALGFVRVVPVPRSRLIDVVVEHPVPHLASDFANGMAEQYIEASLNRRMDTSQESFGWLKKLADEYREKIESDRTAIHEYRKDAKEVSLEENQNIVVGKLKAVSADLTAAESELAACAAEWSKVSEAIKSGQPTVQLSVISEDGAVKVAQGELQRKKSEAALLRTRYQEKHPAVIKVMNEERELQSLCDSACLEASRRVESRYKLVSEKAAGLREALARQEAEALELDRKLVKYNELKREVDADQQMYDTIVARMKEAKVGVDIKASNIRLVDTAEPARRPFRPLWPKAILTSLLFGVALGVAVAFALYFLDDRLRRAEEVEHALGLRLLTVVPPVGSEIPAERSLVADKNSRAPASEAFRSVRASLALRPEWPRERRVMITSAAAGEGKSLVASNFGIVLAHDGQRTVLIDGDMRRPTVHRVFGVEAKYGLSALLKGECELEQALLPTKIPNLTVLAAGKEPDNPSELLGSTAMKKLMDSLSEKFDRIVVDCPPVFGVSDPISLLPAMDGAIFVVHHGRTGRRAAIRAIGRLREGVKPVLGVIFNNVPITRSSGYNYYYRYGYAKDKKGGK